MAIITNMQELQDEDGADIVSEMIGMYLDDTRPRTKALSVAVERGHAVGVKQIARSIRGSSANIGARRLAQFSTQIEALGRDGALESAPHLLCEIKAAHRRVKGQLRAQCSEKPQT